MTNNMEVRELVATAENKQEYDSTTPNHTHEPIKHKGHKEAGEDMEVQTTTVTELEARSVTELQEILNAAKEGTMICVSLEVPDDE